MYLCSILLNIKKDALAYTNFFAHTVITGVAERALTSSTERCEK